MAEEGEVTPPGNTPLIEGLDPGWNDLVQYVPEDKRSEFASGLKERVSSYESLKPWQDFAAKGITPELADTALNLYNIVERNPREVYDTIGKHLGITSQQAQQVVEGMQDEIDEGDDDDPRIQKLQQQVDTLAQIALAKNQQETQAQLQAEQEAQLEKEIAAAKKKFGDDIPDEEIVMRMLHMEMSAEQAAQAYRTREQEIMQRRPAPFVLNGSGGGVPPRSIDPTKLSGKETKSLVAQMMHRAASEERS